MSTGVSRYVEILAGAGLRPWQRFGGSRHVTGELPRLRWRVSPDERERVIAVMNIGVVMGTVTATPDDPAWESETMFGLPYDVDEVLPPNSIILEPIP